MMISADPKPDAPVTPVGHFSIGKGIKVQINHIVQRPHGRGHNFPHLAVAGHVNVAKTEACQVAHHKVARPGGIYNHGVPLPVKDFR